MFPLYDDNPHSRTPWLTYLIVLVNVIVQVMVWQLPSILASQCESCILDFEIFRDHPLPEAFGGGRRLVDRLFLVLRARVSARSQAVHFLNPNRR